MSKISSFFVCLILACSMYGCQPNFGGLQHGLLAHPVPAFNRATIDGSNIDTAALQGKIIVVKFFAKYCEPCKYTLPMTQKVHQELGDTVAVIGVAIDESSVDVSQMIQQYELTFPVIHDPSHVLRSKFRVYELPMTFVIDKIGVVRWIGGGAQTEDDLLQVIESLS